MKAIQIQELGGPEQLKLVDIPDPEPGPKQALIELHAAGVNFIDVYFRNGLYKADLPFVPGNEGAGVVRSIGSEASNVAVGDRVAYAMSRGSYAQLAAVPAQDRLRARATGEDQVHGAAAGCGGCGKRRDLPGGRDITRNRNAGRNEYGADGQALNGP